MATIQSNPPIYGEATVGNKPQAAHKFLKGRWRLDEKDCEVEEKNVIMDKDDSKLLILARYRYLCPRIVKLAIQASMHKPAYQLVDEGIKEFCVKVNNMMKGVENFGTKELDVDDPNFAQVKGTKKKDIGHKVRDVGCELKSNAFPISGLICEDEAVKIFEELARC
ncbi:hypothetical protein HYC85_031749 [Camellia sinensis]|uniref:Uncharacterized protein n=1 Tax=Camellia sinensis TaxID=4442 RepID=A0A7J7FV12_CAMSI|nr:hypothetical protein HYC85_031749 [Camellia sinensis]